MGYLKLSLSAQQRNSEIIHSRRFKRIIILIPALHDMVIRHPFYGRCIGLLVHRGGVQRDGLFVGDVAPAFAVAGEQFRVETPGDYGVDYGIVDAVEIVFFRDGEEVASVVGSGTVFLKIC